ncbi:hypothetical protein JYP49_14185 [Nitratireductor aquimarinus]|uniref:hypothetical protein n=1 Tax=Nitratireductor TaxID=245876 RepID=UPI0019D3E184|nr:MULTISPECIES: hypothetical protein [Nitratireductor]MBN7777746.1 hypothetical protein [Nitratireductor pacificus]MBN7781740.1 hypothetical protein [Nitratireductor pacificus]MBN7790546.1 hypothetical protein [Nitratireductor aquimarinus]MBY6099956.1 hypothetical protein [Nitratireductor aquimarinus]MCA1260422.1 hypothetical protein [Nitratireductor aquimarinus]
MSDKRCVENDTKRGGGVMSTAVQQSASFLNALAQLHHRGRGDTWGAARDRAAHSAGIERSYAKRIWDRWQTMNDVSGEAYMRLRAAYERACERNEEAARSMRAERLGLTGQTNAVDQERPLEGVGMALPEMAPPEREKR